MEAVPGCGDRAIVRGWGACEGEFAGSGVVAPATGSGSRASTTPSPLLSARVNMRLPDAWYSANVMRLSLSVSKAAKRTRAWRSASARTRVRCWSRRPSNSVVYSASDSAPLPSASVAENVAARTASNSARSTTPSLLVSYSSSMPLAVCEVGIFSGSREVAAALSRVASCDFS